LNDEEGSGYYQYDAGIHPDADQYPDSVTAARLDIRWFATDGFSIHSVETRADNDTWECQRDRHPNAHRTRLRFHEPPSGADIIEVELASVHPLEVYSTIMNAIEQRIDHLR
jgi:hypothetical protein